MKNLAKAIIQVMKSVKSIDKNLLVGTGQGSYKGVGDKDVKVAIGQAMQEAGLVIVPTGIESKVTIERWEEESNYGKKQKQSVFTEVVTKYLLIHESGESIEVVGSGHGVDSQDKSAGKATTYALKYALLYLFMVPTGSIDDSDNDHSENKSVPTPEKPWLNKDDFNKASEYLRTGGKIEVIKSKYRISTEMMKNLLTITEKL
jgi:hypothetical protein